MVLLGLWAWCEARNITPFLRSMVVFKHETWVLVGMDPPCWVHPLRARPPMQAKTISYSDIVGCRVHRN